MARRGVRRAAAVRTAPAAAAPTGQAWPADKVERWPIATLEPSARNARKHSPEQVAQLAAAIKEWGFTTAILVDEAGRIIAGHGRVLAAKSLGYADVPVMVARGWTDVQKQAYLVADNKLGLNSSWDEDLLKASVLELESADFSLDLLGFTPEELVNILPGGEPTGDGSAGRTQNAVIQFNIVFDNEVQQQAWFDFVRELKGRYPDAGTLGERLALFIAEPPA